MDVFFDGKVTPVIYLTRIKWQLFSVQSVTLALPLGRQMTYEACNDCVPRAYGTSYDALFEFQLFHSFSCRADWDVRKWDFFFLLKTNVSSSSNLSSISSQILGRNWHQQWPAVFFFFSNQNGVLMSTCLWGRNAVFLLGVDCQLSQDNPSKMQRSSRVHTWSSGVHEFTTGYSYIVFLCLECDHGNCHSHCSSSASCATVILIGIVVAFYKSDTKRTNFWIMFVCFTFM